MPLDGINNYRKHITLSTFFVITTSLLHTHRSALPQYRLFPVVFIFFFITRRLHLSVYNPSYPSSVHLSLSFYVIIILLLPSLFLRPSPFYHHLLTRSNLYLLNTSTGRPIFFMLDRQALWFKYEFICSHSFEQWGCLCEY